MKAPGKRHLDAAAELSDKQRAVFSDAKNLHSSLHIFEGSADEPVTLYSRSDNPNEPLANRDVLAAVLIELTNAMGMKSEQSGWSDEDSSTIKSATEAFNDDSPVSKATFENLLALIDKGLRFCDQQLKGGLETSANLLELHCKIEANDELKNNFTALWRFATYFAKEEHIAHTVNSRVDRTLSDAQYTEVLTAICERGLEAGATKYLELAKIDPKSNPRVQEKLQEQRSDIQESKEIFEYGKGLITELARVEGYDVSRDTQASR